MQTTQPKIDTRPEQPYMGIRSQVPVSEIPNTIRESLEALFPWLQQHNLEPDGAPILRFYVINMENKMDIEVGVPVAKRVAGEGKIQPALLPAGRYASLIYTGVENGMAGNRVLIEWAKEQGLEWDRWDTEAGDNFASRYEVLLEGPQDDPDPSTWDNEVAIKLKD